MLQVFSINFVRILKIFEAITKLLNLTLSYVSCSSTETSFTDSNNVTTYGMVRGCSKKQSGGSETLVEGYANVMAKTSICTTSSCNKVAGSTDNIVKAVAVEQEPESGDLAVILSVILVVILLVILAVIHFTCDGVFDDIITKSISFLTSKYNQENQQKP